jgi:hypothetical protein
LEDESHKDDIDIGSDGIEEEDNKDNQNGGDNIVYSKTNQKPSEADEHKKSSQSTSLGPTISLRVPMGNPNEKAAEQQVEQNGRYLSAKSL